MKASMVLLAALSLLTLGMASIVMAVIVPGLFFPGVYLIDAGMAALVIAGLLHLTARPAAA